jgi:ferric-dicitrate binding protein FerR (iron transport regulator)
MSDEMLTIAIRCLTDEANEKDREKFRWWRENNPEEYEKLNLIFNHTPFNRQHFDVETQKQILAATIRKSGKRSASVRKKSYLFLRIAAAVVVLLAMGASMYLYNRSLSHLITNNTAQIMKIGLPDGSTVTLDKDATLFYKKNWMNRFTRDVTLTGRAYFQIERDVSHKFTVQTADAMIEVLGTKFTVSDNFGKIQVILDEGKVKVDSYRTHDSYLLADRGEQLLITRWGKVKQGIVNKNLYFSWMKDKLNFNHCKVSETLDFLSDSYNLTLIMDDPVALKKHLYGSAPSDNPQLIIQAIAGITEKKVNKIDQTFVFE